MRRLSICALLFAAASIPGQPPAAQQATPPQGKAVPAQPVPGPAQNSAVDGDAIEALGRMSDFLRTLQAFEIKARTTNESVMDDGFKLQFDGTAALKVRRPDRLRADISTDRKQREIRYDGKTITVYGPRIKYYATVEAPSTLRQTIEVLAQRYGIEVPLADLFFWGTEEAPMSDIQAAHYIGPSTVDGAAADQYAYRQNGVDWQVWIARGDQPLPLKLAVTASGERSAPVSTARLTWNLKPRFTDATFAFSPPPGTTRIAIQTVDGKVASVR